MSSGKRVSESMWSTFTHPSPYPKGLVSGLRGSGYWTRWHLAPAGVRCGGRGRGGGAGASQGRKRRGRSRLHLRPETPPAAAMSSFGAG